MVISAIEDLTAAEVDSVSGGDQHTYSWGYALGQWLRNTWTTGDEDLDNALRE